MAEFPTRGHLAALAGLDADHPLVEVAEAEHDRLMRRLGGQASERETWLVALCGGWIGSLIHLSQGFFLSQVSGGGDPIRQVCSDAHLPSSPFGSGCESRWKSFVAQNGEHSEVLLDARIVSDFGR